VKNGVYRGFGIKLRVAIVILLMSLLGIMNGDARHAYAQSGGTVASQIQNDAHNASFMAGRIEARVRQVRTVTYITLVLTLLCLAATVYLVLQKFPAAQDKLVRDTRELIAGLRDSTGLVLIRRRQRKLLRAVGDLQSFADQIRDSHKEMSGLLETIKKEMAAIEKTLEEPPTRTALPKS
jgi:hypothetical protein